MNKKAQASLEFMTTYGWAFLVIAISIGALTFLVKPSDYISDNCYINEGFTCVDYSVRANTLYLKVRNTAGTSVDISELECKYEDQEFNNVYAISNLASGSLQDLSCTSITRLPDSKLKIEFTIEYKESGKSFNSYADGTVITKHNS